MNGIIRYETHSGRAITIQKKLGQLGIDYSFTFKTSHVPCQVQTILFIKPRNDLEWFATLGVIQ